GSMLESTILKLHNDGFDLGAMFTSLQTVANDSQKAELYTLAKNIVRDSSVGSAEAFGDIANKYQLAYGHTQSNFRLEKKTEPRAIDILTGTDNAKKVTALAELKGNDAEITTLVTALKANTSFKFEEMFEQVQNYIGKDA